MKFRIKKSLSVLFFNGAFLMATYSVPAMAENDRGCWSGMSYSGTSCLDYSTYEKGGKTYFKLTNRCEDRLIVKWCADGKCGQDSLRGGQTKTKYERVTHARTQVWYVGSNIAKNDFFCNDGIDGW